MQTNCFVKISSSILLIDEPRDNFVWDVSIGIKQHGFIVKMK